ncbi:Segregation and condensation protein B [hydrothermal vent metagenome]|uniref:Segregation and condensation protein B n=1 Tax=hydrothermal vent metagenome TaxID=652676 RepID=A0A3B0UD24_9ZZZZ
MDSDRPGLPGGDKGQGNAGNVTPFRRPGEPVEHLRIVEAVLFAAAEPLDEASLLARLPDGAMLAPLLDQLRSHYAPRGINLVHVAGKWAFRTADDLAFVMHREAVEQKRLSRAGLETLAIIAYHQPVSRAQIEEVRGVAVSKGTLDVLLQTGWVRLRGRRRTPGRPITYGTSDRFLDHFGLESLDDLPGVDELKAAGLLSGEIPGGFEMPGLGAADDDGGLDEDEDLNAQENEDRSLEDPCQFAVSEFNRALGDDDMPKDGET